MRNQNLKGPVLIVLAITLFGVLSIVGAFCFYVYVGGFSSNLSSQNQDWGAFGSYFGGVLGPILGLISIAILGITLLQQSFQISQQFRDSLKHDVLLLINRIQDDMEKLFEREVELSTGAIVRFGDLVDQLIHGQPMNIEAYSALLKRLSLAQGQYFQSLMLYRDNIDQYFVYTFHSRRLKEIQEFLAKNTRYLNDLDKANIGILGGFIKAEKL